MATQYTRKETGQMVAVRSWGGTSEGVRITLCPDAVYVTDLDEILDGDDGSQRSLRALAAEVGKGGWTERLAERMRAREA